jgi:hypothetical protein
MPCIVPLKKQVFPTFTKPLFTISPVLGGLEIARRNSTRSKMFKVPEPIAPTLCPESPTRPWARGEVLEVLALEGTNAMALGMSCLTMSEVLLGDGLVLMLLLLLSFE